MKTAIRLSPRDPEHAASMAMRAMSHLFLGEVARAIEWSQRAIRHSNYPGLTIHCTLITSLAQVRTPEQ